MSRVENMPLSAAEIAELNGCKQHAEAYVGELVQRTSAHMNMTTRHEITNAPADIATRRMADMVLPEYRMSIGAAAAGLPIHWEGHFGTGKTLIGTILAGTEHVIKLRRDMRFSDLNGYPAVFDPGVWVPGNALPDFGRATEPTGIVLDEFLGSGEQTRTALKAALEGADNTGGILYINGHRLDMGRVSVIAASNYPSDGTVNSHMEDNLRDRMGATFFSELPQQIANTPPVTMSGELPAEGVLASYDNPHAVNYRHTIDLLTRDLKWRDGNAQAFMGSIVRSFNERLAGLTAGNASVEAMIGQRTNEAWYRLAAVSSVALSPNNYNGSWERAGLWDVASAAALVLPRMVKLSPFDLSQEAQEYAEKISTGGALELLLARTAAHAAYDAHLAIGGNASGTAVDRLTMTTGGLEMDAAADRIITADNSKPAAKRRMLWNR